ncbi:MAG: DNA cytosine methyltransferase [Kiritimatiellales bacterium]
MSRETAKTIGAVDLFCGIGGLTRGLQDAGIKVHCGVDLDETCRYAYEKNNKAKFVSKDVNQLERDAIKKYASKTKHFLLAGCAPCQTFSTHTQKNKSRDKDARWELLNSFATLVDDIGPDLVTMENVPSLIKYDIFSGFVRRLKKAGYHVSFSVVKCADYGIPQSRRRLVLLASRLGEINLMPPTHKKAEYKTVRDALIGLAKIKAGTEDKKDPLHKAAGMTDINLRRIKASVPGGTWRDWDDHLRLPCHKRKTGRTYSGVYGRMKWTSVGPTVTTQFYNYGTGRFGHPEQDRALSLREGALLQSFPPDYDFAPPGTTPAFNAIARHIGNAVPVRLGEVIGKSVVRHVEGLI